MPHQPVNSGRRRFIRLTAVSAAIVPLGLLAGRARAQERVDPSDPTAQQLQYTHDSPKADQRCSNCQLYAGTKDDAWAPCPIFAGKRVKGSGWCSAWVVKAG